MNEITYIILAVLLVLNTILTIKNIINNQRNNKVLTAYATEYATVEIFCRTLQQMTNYLSDDIIKNCITNACKCCVNDGTLMYQNGDIDIDDLINEIYNEVVKDKNNN